MSYSAILAACVYGADGKCQGMLTSGCLQILHQKYNEAKSTGLHYDVSAPPQSFASELVGLFNVKPGPPNNLIEKGLKTPSIISSLPTSL